ncbi:MAG: hypothetical protein WBW67_25110 [Pseudolabrys sp.]
MPHQLDEGGVVDGGASQWLACAIPCLAQSNKSETRPTTRAAALPRDRSRRRIEHDLTFQWQIVEGPGALAGMHNQAVTFLAPDEP